MDLRAGIVIGASVRLIVRVILAQCEAIQRAKMLILAKECAKIV